MRRLPALVAALLLPVAQPVLLSAALTSAALLVAQAPAHAQSSEAVGRVAKTITVRIEGATQGSGVLVKRAGNRYTVLTAWHVVSSQGPREELDVYTPDGQRHSVEQGSIQRLGEVDLAVLSFTSSGSYEVASVGDVKSVSSGSSIYVSGFPLPTSAVPTRLMRLLDGRVIANASAAIPNGYQLLYSNQTLPGMSGGAVLNDQGELVGIHASAERADQISETSGKAVATGTNQAVPIAYYKQSSSDAAVIATSAQAATADGKAGVRELSPLDVSQQCESAIYRNSPNRAFDIRSDHEIDDQGRINLHWGGRSSVFYATDSQESMAAIQIGRACPGVGYIVFSGPTGGTQRWYRRMTGFAIKHKRDSGHPGDFSKYWNWDSLPYDYDHQRSY